MLGLYFLAKEAFGDKRIALVSCTIYIAFPFSLVYDKLALYDSLVATLTVWALYLEMRLIKERSIGVALLTVVVIGGGILTKSNAWFFLILLPFSLLVFDFEIKNKNRELLKWLGLVLLVCVGTYACYSLLRFSPNFHYIADKNDTFVYPVNVWIKHPFSYIGENTPQLLRELAGYVTLPFLLLIAASFFIEGRKKLPEKLLLLVWFAVPFIVLDFFGNVHYLFPRYFLFATMALIPLAAYTAVQLFRIKPWFIPTTICVLMALPMLYKDFYILTEFKKASIPISDRKQLISGYASGVGVSETVDYLRKQSERQQIYVGTEGVFGLMPDSLMDYFNGDNNVIVKGYWPIEKQSPQDLLDVAKTKPTYFIFYAPCSECGRANQAPKSWHLKTVFSIRRLDGTTYNLYQVVSQ
jgi:4-amino-4-deoxy-L-arabinose transferase-like glycosyltransferase